MALILIQRRTWHVFRHVCRDESRGAAREKTDSALQAFHDRGQRHSHLALEYAGERKAARHGLPNAAQILLLCFTNPANGFVHELCL